MRTPLVLRRLRSATLHDPLPERFIPLATRDAVDASLYLRRLGAADAFDYLMLLEEIAQQD